MALQLALGWLNKSLKGNKILKYIANMPINDLLVCVDKLPAKSNITVLGDSSKISQLELQVLLSPVNITKTNDNLLLKHQGQRWHHVFDFDRIIKQLRVAEKYNLRGKGENFNNSTQSFSTHLPSPPKNSSKCVQKIKQVLRLNANDMQYYGLVPKTKSENVVVCNICLGIYTRSGFNNHMMIQHPSAWNTVSPKLVSERIVETLSHSGPDGIHDCAVKVSNKNEIESSADITQFSFNNITSRHKSNRNGSILGSNSSSNSRSRSRSKSKHHSTSTSDGVFSLTSNTEVTQNPSKNSRKSLENTVIITTQTEVNQSINYSSSSNSSCSLPTSQKSVPNIPASISGSLDKKYSSNSISNNERKSKGVLEKFMLSVASSKKKDNNSPHTGQESLDSSTSSSSSDFGTISSIGTTSMNSSSAAAFDPKLKIRSESAGFKDIKNRNNLENQLELDQAVSSIVCNESIKSDNSSLLARNCKTSAATNVFNSHPLSDMTNELLHTLSTPNLSQDQNTSTIGDDIPQQNSLDDSSIPTLDDVIDSKFINEILSTAETDMNFDEIEASTTSQQDYDHQQPSAKRMKYEDGIQINIQQSGSIDQLTNDLVLFQQQQQKSQQFSIDNIKIFNNDHQETLLRQQQFTEIDAMQLQQLLYKQQNLNDYGGDSVNSTLDSVRQNQISPQYSEPSLIDSKQLIQLCENDTNKNSEVTDGEHHNEYVTLPSINNEYVNTACSLAANFEIFNIPSITDDNEEEIMMPNENLIYEITGNHQASVVSQQKQQQVIADFLNRTVYCRVDQVTNDSNNEITPTIKNVENHRVLKNGNEYLNLNFSLIDAALSMSGYSTGSITPEQRGCRSNSKFNNNEDFYYNVHTYFGAPKPISINSFGLVKLSSGTATTFRKNLLTTRKANNNSWLNGYVNSIVGGIKMAGLSNKNYFSASSNGLNNMNSANEIIYGTSSSGPVTPTNSIQRNRFKPNSNTNNIGNTNCNFLKNKTSSITLTTATNRMKTKSNAQSISLTSKTIYVNNVTNSSNGVKYIKRSIIPKANIVIKKPSIDAKHLAVFLSNDCQSSFRKQQINQPEKTEPFWDTEEDQLKTQKRMNNFYERRRKLLNLTNMSNIYPGQQQSRTGHQWKANLKKTQIQISSDSFQICSVSQAMSTNTIKSNESIRVIV